MKRYFLISAIAAMLASNTLAAAPEKISLDYSYEGDTGVSLATVMGGPLTVNDFTDGRPDSGDSDIQRPGKEPLTLNNQSAASLLQTTFIEAFEASDAQLGDVGSPISLDGKVMELQVLDTAKGLETLIRVELTLRNQGRNAWQSVIFSRVESESKDPAAAIELGLNRLIAELFRDDYFLMELGIF